MLDLQESRLYAVVFPIGRLHWLLQVFSARYSTSCIEVLFFNAFELNGRLESGLKLFRSEQSINDFFRQGVIWASLSSTGHNSERTRILLKLKVILR